MRVTQHLKRADTMTLEDARRIMAVPEAEYQALVGWQIARSERAEAARVLARR